MSPGRNFRKNYRKTHAESPEETPGRILEEITGGMLDEIL